MLAIVLFSGQLKKLLRIPWRVWVTVFAAAVLIAVNWGTYIVAVNSDHVADAALGYFINPLVSVLLGGIFLGGTAPPAAVAIRRNCRGSGRCSHRGPGTSSRYLLGPRVQFWLLWLAEKTSSPDPNDFSDV